METDSPLQTKSLICWAFNFSTNVPKGSLFSLSDFTPSPTSSPHTRPQSLWGRYHFLEMKKLKCKAKRFPKVTGTIVTKTHFKSRESDFRKRMLNQLTRLNCVPDYFLWWCNWVATSSKEVLSQNDRIQKCQVLSQASFSSCMESPPLWQSLLLPNLHNRFAKNN